MTWEEYKKETGKYAIYPYRDKFTYLSLGLMSEIGEVCGILKKEIRDGVFNLDDLSYELGDVCWYIAELENAGLEMFDSAPFAQRSYTALAEQWLSGICFKYDINVEDMLIENIAKLKDRKERGVLGGSGSNR